MPYNYFNEKVGKNDNISNGVLTKIKIVRYISIVYMYNNSLPVFFASQTHMMTSQCLQVKGSL